MNKTLVVFTLLSTFAINAYAADTTAAGPRQRAIDACGGKADGDTCSFIGVKNNTREGVCHKAPKLNNALICKPNPPQAAVDACKGLLEGATCSFVNKKNVNRTGTCSKLPNGDIACKPKLG